MAKQMHPHFILEKEIAIPPLGLLQYLARGEIRADVKAVLLLTDKLKDNLSETLNQHIDHFRIGAFLGENKKGKQS